MLRHQALVLLVALVGCTGADSSGDARLIFEDQRYEVADVAPSLWLDSENDVSTYALDIASNEPAGDSLLMTLIFEFPHLPESDDSVTVTIPDSEHLLDVRAFHCGASGPDCESDLVGTEVWEGNFTGDAEVGVEGSLVDLDLRFQGDSAPKSVELRVDHVAPPRSCFRDGSETNACAFLQAEGGTRP